MERVKRGGKKGTIKSMHLSELEGERESEECGWINSSKAAG